MENDNWKDIQGIILSVHQHAKRNSLRLASMESEIKHLSEKGTTDGKYYFQHGSLYRQIPGSDPEFITRDAAKQTDIILKVKRTERLTELFDVREKLLLKQSYLLTNLRLLQSHLD